MEKKNWLIDIWTDGRYADLWSVNHFLSGIVLAHFAVYFNFSFFWGFLVAVFLMIVWEIYETIVGAREQPPNKVTDVVFGILGFLSFFYFDVGEYFFFAILMTFVALEIWGYWAYKKREALEAICQK